MTPGARIAAAIEILDRILAGAAAEKTLTSWARRSRFAGSADRASIRDLVFDALRRRRSFGYLGGSDTGRGLMIGALLARGEAPANLFSGEGYAPSRPTVEEMEVRDLAQAPPAVQLDVPDWLYPAFTASLGADTSAILQRMQTRAPVFLRVNRAKTRPGAAVDLLAEEGIACTPHPLSQTALVVEENARKIQNSRVFRDGLVELQDAASQAVCEALHTRPGDRVLDFCAGGGGKALALAARDGVAVLAHDADATRMRDLPVRAGRAGVQVACLSYPEVARKAPFDLVLCDAPCTGSGAWRRSPEAKWRLTASELLRLQTVQAEILDQAAALVAPRGRLAYATCSLLDVENGGQTAAFLVRNPGWASIFERRWTPLDGGDGFYLSVLGRLTDHP